MLLKSLPRLLLGLITLSATIVEPMTSVLHGVAHAAAALHEHEGAVRSGDERDIPSARERHGSRDVVEAPEHDGAHEALHRAATLDASTPSAWDAMPSPQASRITVQPSIVARVSPTQSDDRPPDFGLGLRDLARAPPLV